MTRTVAVVFHRYRLTGDSWQPPATPVEPCRFVADLAEEYEKFGIAVSCLEEDEPQMEVRGYADLLNTVRLRTGDSNLGNPCLGHVIGQSANCDLLEDIRRGLSRIVFAPETIEPDGTSKRVCHNCGCGC